MKHWVRAIIIGIVLGVTLFVQSEIAFAEQPPNRAALIVSYDEGDTVSACVSFDEPEITGYELLSRSGLDIESEDGSGFGEAVCRIGGIGCDLPQQACFCQCQGVDCYYWSYWRMQDAAWTYAQFGASLATVRNGSVDGWVWHNGPFHDGAERTPPSVKFEDVCSASAPLPPAEIPEPVTVILVGSGLAAVVAIVSWRRNSAWLLASGGPPLRA